MFDPKKWIQQSWSDDDTKTVTIAGEAIRIRRLKGTQWEHYIRAVKGTTDEASVAVILQYGLVNGAGHYHTYEEMVRFYDACPVLADKIAAAILEHTMQRMNAENKVLEDAEKNSVMTTTPSPSDVGVVSSDKTPEQQS